MLLLSLLLNFQLTFVQTKLCPEELKTSTGGVIVSPNYDVAYNLSGICTYTIKFSGTLRVQLIDVIYYEGISCKDCCDSAFLKIESNSHSSTYCRDNFTYDIQIYHASESPLKIRYEWSKIPRTSITLTYSTSRLCKGFEHECLDKSGCYNRRQICDKINQCTDTTDEKDCGRKYCGAYFQQRNQCMDEKCLHIGYKDVILENCVDRNGRSESTFPTFSIFVLIFAFVMVFLMLVLRWHLSRRDIRYLMENWPEFPVPPFRAPGEDFGISEADLQSGGEIYEAFAEGRRQNENERKSRIKVVKSKETKRLINPEDADESLVALASLSIDINSCIGLNKENFRKMGLFDETTSPPINEASRDKMSLCDLFVNSRTSSRNSSV